MADSMEVEVPEGELLLRQHLEKKEIERQKLYNPAKYGTPVLSRVSEIVYTPHHEQICVLYFNHWIKRFNTDQIEYFKNNSKFLPLFRERFAKCVFSLSRLIGKKVDVCLELLGHEQANPHIFPKIQIKAEELPEKEHHYRIIETFTQDGNGGPSIKICVIEGEHYRKIETFTRDDNGGPPIKIWVDHPDDCCYVGWTAREILNDFLPEDYKQLMEK